MPTRTRRRRSCPYRFPADGRCRACAAGRDRGASPPAAIHPETILTSSSSFSSGAAQGRKGRNPRLDRTGGTGSPGRPRLRGLPDTRIRPALSRPRTSDPPLGSCWRGAGRDARALGLACGDHGYAVSLLRSPRQEPSDPVPSLNDGTRAMELSEAVVRSSPPRPDDRLALRGDQRGGQLQIDHDFDRMRDSHSRAADLASCPRRPRPSVSTGRFTLPISFLRCSSVVSVLRFGIRGAAVPIGRRGRMVDRDLAQLTNRAT